MQAGDPDVEETQDAGAEELGGYGGLFGDRQIAGAGAEDGNTGIRRTGIRDQGTGIRRTGLERDGTGDLVVESRGNELLYRRGGLGRGPGGEHGVARGGHAA